MDGSSYPDPTGNGTGHYDATGTGIGRSGPDQVLFSLVTRLATTDDVATVCQFGNDVFPAHYAPLIGAEAAAEQVSQWWSPSHIREAVNARSITIAELDSTLVQTSHCPPVMSPTYRKVVGLRRGTPVLT